MNLKAFAEIMVESQEWHFAESMRRTESQAALDIHKKCRSRIAIYTVYLPYKYYHWHWPSRMSISFAANPRNQKLCTSIICCNSLYESNYNYRWVFFSHKLSPSLRSFWYYTRLDCIILHAVSGTLHLLKSWRSELSLNHLVLRVRPVASDRSSTNYNRLQLQMVDPTTIFHRYTIEGAQLERPHGSRAIPGEFSVLTSGQKCWSVSLFLLEQ